jgi:hypothetical protein
MTEYNCTLESKTKRNDIKQIGIQYKDAQDSGNRHNKIQSDEQH